LAKTAFSLSADEGREHRRGIRGSTEIKKRSELEKSSSFSGRKSGNEYCTITEREKCGK
jgi:hypothetical protein